MDDPPFVNFQKFYDRAVAADMVDQLKRRAIPAALDEPGSYFDPSFAHNPLHQGIWVQVKAADFPKASATLEAYYASRLDHVNSDYYLFQLSDEELVDIVHSPDQWGFLDYPLAVRILQDRGIEWSRDEMVQVRSARIQTLAAPENTGIGWIIFSYALALGCWPAGLIAGSIMNRQYKTLPDGGRVPAYSPKDRRHGRWIIGLSLVGFLWWMVRLISSEGRSGMSFYNF